MVGTSIHYLLLHKLLLNTMDLYGERYGMGIILAGDSAGIGRYTLPQ